MQQIEAKYAQAHRELDRVILGRTNTAQARYDRKKALAKGHEPKRYTVGVERVKHELDIEMRWVLKGVQETVDYLVEHTRGTEFPKWLKEVVGDVEAALDARTEETSENPD